MEVIDEIAIEKYPVYKDSGVEWLGEIPEHWKIRRIKSVIESECNGIWGNDPKEECDTFCIRVSDFDRNKLKVSIIKLTLREILSDVFFSRSIKRGDLLIEKSGGGDKTLVGQVVLFEYNIKAVCSNFVARLRLKEESESCFMNYLFNTLYLNSINYKHIKQTTGIQNLDTSSYFNEYFALPSYKEQTAIARFLDNKTALIDKAIAIKEKQIELLKERRQILIHRAVTRGLNPNVKFKDSGVEWIGEIPEHWDAEKLKYHFDLVSGGTPSKEDADYWNGKTPWVSPKDMKLDYIETTEDFVTNKALSHAKVKLIPKNTLLMVVRSGILQRLIPVAISLVNVTINQDLKAFVRIGRLSSEYLFYFIKGCDSIIRNYCVKQIATVESIEIPLLQNFYTLIPPENEQQEIIKYIGVIAEKVELLTSMKIREIEKLKEYRSSLINSAVTGKIKVC